MKNAHIYRLNVVWSYEGPQWDIKILAIDASAVSSWILSRETEDTYILSMNISLITRNAERVADNFCARGLDN